MTTVSTEGAQVRTAHARKEEQRGQRPEAQLYRVCSAFNQEVTYVEQNNLNVDLGLQAEESGQLPDLG